MLTGSLINRYAKLGRINTFSGIRSYYLEVCVPIFLRLKFISGEHILLLYLQVIVTFCF